MWSASSKTSGIFGVDATISCMVSVAADGELIGEMKVIEAEIAADVVGTERKGEVQVFSGERGEGERPGLDARETICRAGLPSSTRSNTGKGDRHAATNGFAGGELAFAADEDHGLLAGGLPVCEVRSLYVDPGGGVRGGDAA